MNENFAQILSVGGKSNSLGRAGEVVELVLNDKNKINELYDCIFNDDAWVRMRAIDSLEKVCRVHPEWFEAYVDKFLNDLTEVEQPSIQWHLAELFREMKLNSEQEAQVISWLRQKVSTIDVDWIVAANTLETLAHFTAMDSFQKTELKKLALIQLNHKSKAVNKKAAKIIEKFSA